MDGKKKNEYYCPMKCEGDKVYDHPGSCPKCGMALVSEKAEETSEEEKANKKMAKKFRVAMGLSIPVLIIAMSDFPPFLKLDEITTRKVWG